MTQDIVPQPIDGEKQRLIESLFANLPSSLPDRYVALQSIRMSFYAELARKLEPALNAYANSRPQVTQEDRSNLATSINSMVRHLGLSLKCDRTGLPVILTTDTKRTGSQETLRYRYYKIGSRSRVATKTSTELPKLELCQAPVRIESLSREFLDGVTSRGK